MIAGQQIGAQTLDGLLYKDEYERIYAGVQGKPDLAVRIDGADMEERRTLRRMTALESLATAQQLAVALEMRARLHAVRTAWRAFTEQNDDLAKGALAVVTNGPLLQADEFSLNFQDFINRRAHYTGANAPMLGAHLEDLALSEGLLEELDRPLPFLHYARLVRVLRPPQSTLGYFEVELVGDAPLIDRPDYYADTGPPQGAEPSVSGGEVVLLPWRQMLHHPLPILLVEKIGPVRA